MVTKRDVLWGHTFQGLTALLRWGRATYVLDLDRKRLAYGLRETTAFTAPVVSMQLLPIDQC